MVETSGIHGGGEGGLGHRATRSSLVREYEHECVVSCNVREPARVGWNRLADTFLYGIQLQLAGDISVRASSDAVHKHPFVIVTALVVNNLRCSQRRVARKCDYRVATWG